MISTKLTLTVCQRKQSRTDTDVAVAVARDEMVIGEAGGLHKGIDDRGADEPEPAADHVLADRLGFRGLHRDLSRRNVVG